MESVDVSIVNYFISISSSAARQDIIKCAAWSWVTNLSPKLIFESSCIWSVSWVIVKCFTGNVKWLRELTNFESYSDVRLCMTGSMKSVNLEGDWLKLTDHEWSRLLFTLAPERRSDQVRCEPNHSRHCVHWHVETSEILEMPHGSRTWTWEMLTCVWFMRAGPLASRFYHDLLRTSWSSR